MDATHTSGVKWYSTSATIPSNSAKLLAQATEADGTSTFSEQSHGTSENEFEISGTVPWACHARGREWCLRLGMTSSAWDGWCKLHTNPLVAMCYFFGFVVLTNAVSCVLAVGIQGNSFVEKSTIISTGFHLVMVKAIFFLFWRWGPGVSCQRLYLPLIFSCALSAMPLMLLGNLGPEALVPWGNRLHFLIGNCVWLLCGLQGFAAGIVPGEHPAEPRSSIMYPVARAFVQAILWTDFWSDASLIRSLMNAVRCLPVKFWCDCSVFKSHPCTVFQRGQMVSWCRGRMDAGGLETRTTVGTGTVSLRRLSRHRS